MTSQGGARRIFDIKSPGIYRKPTIYLNPIPAIPRPHPTKIAEMALEITPLTPAVGAEIGGVDLGEPLDSSIIEKIYKALVEHLVIFFRNQKLTPQAQVRFSAQFGTLDRPHPVYPPVEGFAEIVKLENDGEHPADTNEWHTDLTFRQNPPFAAVLRAVDVPTIGGDTLWASMHAAYQALPAAVKQQIEPLYAVHDMGSFRNSALGRDNDVEALNHTLAEAGSAVHKVVKHHPVTGRPILYVNQSFTRHIVGMSTGDSDRLLHYLYSSANQPEFQVRFRWHNGAVAMWDNRASQHYAVADYAPAYRCMHRVTVLDDKRTSAALDTQTAAQTAR